MTVVIVDWLGRGGIGQTTEAWAIELTARGIGAEVVTRPGRELGVGSSVVHEAAVVRGRLRSHRAVAERAAALIRDRRPDWVVVQNYVVPALERPVYRAASDVGAKVAVVVHDHRLHTLRAGTRAGLRGALSVADRVVAHSEFVASSLGDWIGRQVHVLPHPVPLGVLAAPRPDVDLGERLVCGHFGVLTRRYKGTDVFLDMARAGVPGWDFLVAGVGAPTDVPEVRVVGDYVDAGRLAGIVSRTAATAMPYRFATQSGVAVLAHALGSVPIASAVGGLPEQIEDGVDGLLLPPGASVREWTDAVASLSDDTRRKAFVVAGEARVWADHQRFVELLGRWFA